MSNSKRVREELLKQAGWVKLGRCAIHGNDLHRHFDTCKDFQAKKWLPPKPRLEKAQ